MQITPSKFNEQKAEEIIGYIASKCSKCTFHQAFKLLYLADKFHLEKYGRLILEDNYIAMKYGPVPSEMYAMLKLLREPFSNKNKRPISVENKDAIKILREPDLDLMSESEQECLDESIDKYGKYSFQQLTNLSHDLAWESADENGIISIENIIKTLKNSELLLDHFQKQHGD